VGIMSRTSTANVRLMAAAIDLMWEESYGAVTIDDICTRADVKKGSFYYYFESKADLAVAALEYLWAEEWKPTMDRHFSATLEPLARLTAYLESIYHKQTQIKARFGKVLGCPVCSVGSEISTQEPALCAKAREIVGRKLRYYESAIRDAVTAGVIEPCDPAQKALALIGLLEGLVGYARMMNDPEALRELPAMGLELLKAKPAATAALPLV
jgi:TetR/AcrR family transcriptional repressor of nem operon